MAKRITITGDQVVAVLKQLGTAQTAASIAANMIGTDSRAVATALRQPVDDGRVSRTWRRSKQQASYRFVRLAAKAVQP